jgi:hypothetical protein
VPEVAPELDPAEDDAGIAADEDGGAPDQMPEPPKDAAPVVDMTMPPEVAPEVMAPDPLAKDLVARWTFEEGRGNVVADSVGGNDGTFSSGGVTWRRNNFTGVRAKSLWSIELDGTSGYVTHAGVEINPGHRRGKKHHVLDAHERKPRRTTQRPLAHQRPGHAGHPDRPQR